MREPRSPTGRSAPGPRPHRSAAWLPPVTTLLTLGASAVYLLSSGLLSSGPHPWIPLRGLALDPGATVFGPGTWLWWLAHGSLGHLATNVALLWWVGPQLERHVGAGHVALAATGGAVGGAVAHVVVHGADVPILGLSTIVSALLAYNLVIGWHRPFEDRRGRAVFWPSTLFHVLLGVEVIRVLAELATQGPPTAAAAHLGGGLAGVLVCGLLHGRWPGAPGTHAAATSLRLLRPRPSPPGALRFLAAHPGGGVQGRRHAAQASRSVSRRDRSERNCTTRPNSARAR
jgi:membrane associated rhomboid family serine protease